MNDDLRGNDFARSLRAAWGPLALTSLRLALAPVMLFGIVLPFSRPFLGVCVVVAFLSDWLDGVVARRWGVAFPWLRRYDIVADVAFFLCAVALAIAREPQQLGPYLPWVACLVLLEVVVQLWHWLRFRVPIATHSWVNKGWSVVMSLALAVLLATGYGGVLLFLAFVMGTLAYLDVVLILLLARRVPLDVISFWHVRQAALLSAEST